MPPSLAERPPVPLGQWVLLASVLAYGVALRAGGLAAQPFTVDEAESSINALTILQHGVPVDHYLGLPLFENTLTQPWPESDEYEFKDSSYSERGLAVYHGWFPLYVAAAAFTLAGVEPDEDATAPRVRHTAAEMRRRTLAGRVPAVVFGAAFLVLAFVTARELYGPDAAWAALTAGAVCVPLIYSAQQARYYAATLTLTLGCCLLTVRMARRGRWRDHLIGAALFALLAHTHVLSFVVSGLAFALTVPFWDPRPRRGLKLAAFAGLVTAAVLPWVALTGFLRAALDVPKAHTLLSAEDLLALGDKLGGPVLLTALALTGILSAAALRGRLPERVVRPFADHRGTFVLLAVWALLGLVGFVALVPAASYFHGRLVLALFVPGFLFGAILCAAGARVLSPRAPVPVACGLLVLILAASGQARFWARAADPDSPTTFDVIEALRGLELRPDARVYATPNQHLVLTFYTGMPVQSVAPVRKSFLDRYEGELLILEAGPRFEPVSWQEVRRVLREIGEEVSEAEARQLESLLATHLVREELLGRGAVVSPPAGPAPPFVNVLTRYQRGKTAVGLRTKLALEGNPLCKGFPLADYGDWWPTFYYRFVDPEARGGARLNYGDRMKGARAVVLPLTWVALHCPARRIERRSGPLRKPPPLRRVHFSRSAFPPSHLRELSSLRVCQCHSHRPQCHSHRPHRPWPLSGELRRLVPIERYELFLAHQAVLQFQDNHTILSFPRFTISLNEVGRSTEQKLSVTYSHTHKDEAVLLFHRVLAQRRHYVV